MAYRVIAQENLEVLNWLEFFRLEDCRVGQRVWHEVLGGEGANLRIRVRDEAHELGELLAKGFG